MNIYSLSVLLFSFGVFLIAVLGLFKRRDNISIRFSYFSISVCGWGFMFSVWTSGHYSPEVSLALIRFFEVFAVFIPITWLHFILEYIGEKEPFKGFYRANYLLAIVLAAFCPTPWFFKGVHEVPVFGYYKSPGPIFYVFLAVFCILVPTAFYYLVKACIRLRGQAQKQAGFLLIGWFFAFFAGSSTFLPAFHITNYYWLLCLLPAYPFFLGIAMIRYGLFDADIIAEAFQREKLMAIGTVAASLNHELKNPLFIAKGKAETFFDHMDRGLCPADAKSRLVVESMYAQLVRASDIMQRFSDFAKPFYNEVKKESVVISEVFNNVLQLVSSEFALNKIRVNQTSASGLSLKVNSRHFEEILFNLTLNACHAMEKHGGELTLHAYQPNGKVIVEISDSGPGIPKDLQKRIFEPFYTTKGSNGTGLGLYITKQLVERNSGKIKVDSKLGRGTTFKLELANA